MLFHLEDSVPDAGTMATVGRAVAGAAAAESRSPSEPATENRTWDLYGEYWEEGTFTRFGCEWGLFFETIPSCASAMVVVSRSAGLLKRFRANTDLETESVRVTDFFFLWRFATKYHSRWANFVWRLQWSTSRCNQGGGGVCGWFEWLYGS